SFLITRRPPSSPLFPYTTLFRSEPAVVHQDVGTAEITKVEKVNNVQPYALLPASSCTSSVNACLYGGGTPYVDYGFVGVGTQTRSEEHTSELQSRENLVCRLLLE